MKKDEKSNMIFLVIKSEKSRWTTCWCSLFHLICFIKSLFFASILGKIPIWFCDWTTICCFATEWLKPPATSHLTPEKSGSTSAEGWPTGDSWLEILGGRHETKTWLVGKSTSSILRGFIYTHYLYIRIPYCSGGMTIPNMRSLDRGTHSYLGGGNSNIFYFHPDPCRKDPNWRAYFSKGLKPPISEYIFIHGGFSISMLFFGGG